jgi:hypothetical protein
METNKREDKSKTGVENKPSKRNRIEKERGLIKQSKRKKSTGEPESEWDSLESARAEIEQQNGFRFEISRQKWGIGPCPGAQFPMWVSKSCGQLLFECPSSAHSFSSSALDTLRVTAST